MGPTSIVGDTEGTRFCPQTDRRTDRHQYTPLSTLKQGGIKTGSIHIYERCLKNKIIPKVRIQFCAYMWNKLCHDSARRYPSTRLLGHQQTQCWLQHMFSSMSPWLSMMLNIFSSLDVIFKKWPTQSHGTSSINLNAWRIVYDIPIPWYNKSVSFSPNC